MFLNASASGGAHTARLGGFNTQILGNLTNVGGQLEKTLLALSTGYRINSASDGPAASMEISRTDAHINNIATALDNNELSFNRLCGVDGVQKEILSILLEMRDNAQKMQNTGDAAGKQVLMETIAAQMSAIDTLTKSARIGGKTVLDGSSEISFGVKAAACLDTRASFVRSTRNGASISLAFDGAAAEEACISGALALPSGSASSFMITTASGSKTINLADGISLTDALKQMNKSLAAIGARAEVYADSNGTPTLSFLSNGYGSNYSIRYDHVSGTNLIGGNFSDTGKTGTVRINAANYALAGDYCNAACEGAQVRGAAAAGAVAATDLTFTTADGSASFSGFSAASVADAIAALNADAQMQELGIHAALHNDMLSFTTDATGTSAVLDFTDSAGALFADGRRQAAAGGRDYHPGAGLAVNYSTQEISANLSFAYDKVAAAAGAQGQTAPGSFSLTLEAHGGSTFQIGSGNGFYDSVTYSFRNISAAGLGLNQLLDSSSPLYLMKNGSGALNYIDTAISTVQSEYGALGAFMNYNLNSTNSAMEALQSSLSDSRGIIANADMAAAALEVVRLQILQSSSISALTSSAGFSQMMASLLPSNN